MSEEVDYKTQRKRDYHREWRKNHPESVMAAQMKYWAKKSAQVEEMNRRKGRISNEN